MLKFVYAAGVIVGLATLAPSADAHTWRHRHYTHGNWYHHHDHYFRLGYHRAGPPHGYRFGFATYAGDPFARDDYYDGRGCYYLHRRDFCRGPKSLDWLRFR
jgi:hypothetical protein